MMRKIPLAVYRNALDAALAYARSVLEEESAAIREVDRALAPIKTRNARTDFFGLDAQLVEMIPFSLWYESKYDTVLTISRRHGFGGAGCYRSDAVLRAQCRLCGKGGGKQEVSADDR